MSLLAVKERILFYIQRSSGTFVEGSTDILLEELNQVRVALERLYNFKHLRDSGELLVTGSGVSLSTLDTSSELPFKEIRQLWLVQDSQEIPVTYVTREKLHNIRNRSLRRKTLIDSIRYPGDLGAYNLTEHFNNARLFLDGSSLYTFGTSDSVSSLNIKVDCFVWSAPWEDYDAEDWFTTNAKDYLVFATLKRLNLFTQTFPDFRQEGTVSAGTLDKMIANAVYELTTQENFDSLSAFSFT